MKLIDHLGGFSVEDLRELAKRRGIPLRQEALQARQTLLRTLSGSLGGYDAIHAALNGLNQAELSALHFLLRDAKQASLSALGQAFGAPAAEARKVLEELRLWGLVFPEGDWEHISIPGATQLIANYLNGVRPDPGALTLSVPGLEPAPDAGLQARPASFAWDMAEFLARISRSRLKLTQAGRMNRRDLRSMDTAFTVPTYGYSSLIYLMATGLWLLQSKSDILVASERADAWLAQPEEARTLSLIDAWQPLRGYAESASTDPSEADHIPYHLPRQRGRFLSGVREMRAGAVSVASLGMRLAWLAPRTFEQWDSLKNPAVVAQRMARTLYWLGLLKADDPEKPTRVALTPLGARVLGVGEANGAALVPEDPFFFLQPNAESFCPPNLSPRTLFHLRRMTGEKKGGPTGVYPLTQDSLRRALDSGLTPAAVIHFLERYSKTGLPDNVKTLVETAGRQHGRIRLAPAEYVLVTDDPVLLEEISRLKQTGELLGAKITERSVSVKRALVPELLRRLRARGYAPMDDSDDSQSTSLPLDPAEVPPAPETPTPSYRASSNGELDWSAIEQGDDAEVVERAGPITDRFAIKELLTDAAEEGLEVEIEYHSLHQETTVRTIQPLYVSEYECIAYCCLRMDERQFVLSRMSWARLTGGTFDSEDV